MEATRVQIARLDQDRIDDLVAVLCDIETAKMRGLNFEDLGDALACLTESWRACNIAMILHHARAVEKLGSERGYSLLERVAGDVLATGMAGDAAAFAATFDRLIRLLEGALAAAFSAPDAVS